MISVVIPTYHEEKSIQKTIEVIKDTAKEKDFEIIVVDASNDNATKKAIQTKEVKVISSEKGRAIQMNNGAKKATGDILLFLHADTRLPKNWDFLIRKAIQQGYQAGGFLKQFEPSSFLLKINQA